MTDTDPGDETPDPPRKWWIPPMASNAADAILAARLTEMRALWGADIVQIEYLLHLLETGRIVEEGQ